MNTWGNIIKVTVFGESHGSAIGCVVDGLKPGLLIDEEYIASEMARRAPGRDEFSTARTEADTPLIISGIKNGLSTGAPITCVIENTNQRSGDYDKILRPGHADWTSLLKYGRCGDMAGGGRFSGRLTAPLVFAGAICKLALRDAGIRIYGRISAIAGEKDSIDLAGERVNAEIAATEKQLAGIAAKPFPAPDESEQRFKDLILAAKADGDSVGGTIEVAVFGETAGLGEPFFGSVESTLSSLYFSVPAVKAVEWGAGFHLAGLRGSEANDPLMLRGAGDNKRVVSATNNNGGILGGIANGMPLFARVAIKPTASIAKEQDMIAYDPGADGELTEVRASVRGRHDPCIVPRAVPVIEAVTAIGLLDLLSAAPFAEWRKDHADDSR
ncbi:MAG: chorismate synthase [Clostridiales Family XIII bacterium]|jgi:chorismate synthase|nr:chorismate synthase [Clostridiales Family XIII bacterium]